MLEISIFIFQRRERVRISGKDTVSSERVIFLILFAVTMICQSGCSHIKVPAEHVVMFNEDGKLLDPTGNVGCATPPRLCEGGHFTMLPYFELQEEQRVPYVKNIVTNLIEKAPTVEGKRRLLIYVHGGLNTQKGTVERASELTPKLIGNAKYYPLFINWRSSLVSSYFDHAFFIRQGEESPIIGPITSPVVIAVDVGRAIFRAPLVWGSQIKTGLETLPEAGLPYGLDGRQDYLKNQYQTPQANQGPEKPIPIETGSDKRTGWDEAMSGISWFLLSPVRMLVAAPLIDGLGTSAWENMLRRTQLLFHSTEEFRGKHRDGPQGDLTWVMKKIEEEINKTNEKWEIVLVGHSMGTIVLNELLRQFPDMEYSTIVYMAAACSVRDFEQSVIPYLKSHKDAQFYNLTLHYIAEERERWDLGVRYFDPAMRGSLLTWIDNFLSDPLTPMDKTLGSYVNFLRTEQILSGDVRGRIHLKEFSVGGDSVGKEPQKHGDFGKSEFWNEQFYHIGLPQN